MTRVLSGVQPTGNLHLGNYLGAIKNWVAMQTQYDECLYCIVDLHAITVPQDPEALRQATRKTAATYLACGIDPKKSTIFVQSSVPGHTELAWMLGCITPLGWPNRMTQFKEKAGKHKDQSSLGLYGYPVLMAADILLYHTTHVPVGEDQKQHLELTRDIAGAFNRQFGVEHFALPEPLIMGEATRVMSLRDGTKKMSKSDESDQSRINLTDSKDAIVQKIKRAKSDMLAGITYDAEVRPEATNLLNIYMATTGIAKDKLLAQVADLGFADFKTRLSEVLADHLTPISQKIDELMGDTAYLDKLLQEGAQKANAIADKNMRKVKEIMGFLSF